MRYLITFYFLLTTIICNAQSEEWNTYTFDSAVSEIQLPLEPFVLDTIVSGMEMRILYSNTFTASFQVQRIKLDVQNEGPMASKKDLSEFYRGFVNSYNPPYGALKNVEPMETQGFEGRKITGKDIESNNPSTEQQTLVINEYVYSFVYTNPTDFNKEERDAFFNSIQLKLSENDYQYREDLSSGSGYQVGYFIGQLVAFLVFGGLIIALIIFIIKKLR